MNDDFIKEKSFVLINSNIEFFADLADYVLDVECYKNITFIFI